MSDEVEDVDVGGEVEEPQVDASPESAPAETEQPAPDVWSHFRAMEQFQGQDDNAIAQRLYEAMQREEHAARALQQYQTAIPVVQDYLSHRSEFEKWKASQSQQQAAPQQPVQQQAEPGWWNPPQVKDSYKRYLTRDEQGREVISPDAPIDARAALEDYMTYRAEFAQKFLDNPEQALGGMVEKIAAQRAENIIEQRLGRMQDENYVASLEEENKDWLYDENGNVSAEGVLVQKYISDAKQAGIVGAKARWDFATKMVERDLLLQTMQRMRQPQQPQQRPLPQAPQAAPAPQRPTVEQQNMDYLRQQAMRTASQRSSGTTNARVPDKSMTFQERLLAAAQEQGMF